MNICRCISYICIMKNEVVKDILVDKSQSIVRVDVISASTTPNHAPRGYHYHNCYQIVIVEKGYIEFMVNCMLQRVNCGAIIMVGSDLPHGVVSFSDDIKVTLLHIPHTTISWCSCIPELEKSVQFIRESQFGYIFKSNSLHKKTILISRKLQKSSGFQQMSVLFELLDLLSKELAVERLVTNPDQQPILHNPHQAVIEKAIDYLYKHFQEELVLENIAEYVHQNPSALCRAFKKRTGYTIFQFANRLRIEQACQLLRSTDLNVTQVAFQVGFNSFSCFSVQFQRIVHLSPTEYREKVMEISVFST